MNILQINFTLHLTFAFDKYPYEAKHGFKKQFDQMAKYTLQNSSITCHNQR